LHHKMKAKINHVFILSLLLITIVNSYPIIKTGQQSIEDIIDL